MKFESSSDTSMLKINQLMISRYFVLYGSLISISLFISGATSLSYQIVWQRILAQEIGVDAISVTITVAIFMLGLAFGTYVGRKLSELTFRPILLYFAFELIISFYALESYSLLKEARGFFFSSVTVYYYDFILYACVLFIPTCLMGAGVPIIMKVLGSNGKATSSVFGLIYGINLAGAFAGTLLTSFLVVEKFGLSGSLELSAYFNLLIPVLILPLLWMEFKAQRQKPLFNFKTPTTPKNAVFSKSKHLTMVISAILYGFVTLSLEIIMFRVLSNYFGTRSIIFPILLASFLLNMAIGEWIGAALCRLKKISLNFKILFLYALSLTVLVSLFWIPESYLLDIGINQRIARIPRELPFFFIVTSCALLPVIFLSSLFPLFIRSSATENEAGETIVGRILFYSTIGNFLGATITGLILLPMIGTMGTGLPRVCLTPNSVTM